MLRQPTPAYVTVHIMHGCFGSLGAGTAVSMHYIRSFGPRRLYQRSSGGCCRSGMVSTLSIRRWVSLRHDVRRCSMVKMRKARTISRLRASFGSSFFLLPRREHRRVSYSLSNGKNTAFKQDYQLRAESAASAVEDTKVRGKWQHIIYHSLPTFSDNWTAIVDSFATASDNPTAPNIDAETGRLRLVDVVHLRRLFRG